MNNKHQNTFSNNFALEVIKRIEFSYLQHNFSDNCLLKPIQDAIGHPVSMQTLYDDLFDATHDSLFSNRVCTLYNMFNKRNPILDKRIMQALTEAKDQLSQNA